MKIVAGGTTIHATTLIGEQTTYSGQVVDSIKVFLDCDVTQEQIDDLTTLPWEIYDDNNVHQSTQEGFNVLYQYVMTFIRVPDVVKENEALKAALAAKEAELQAALAQIGSN